MRLALDAIERSKTGEKADIIKALFETKDRSSVLGTYSIDENGDTTLTDYGIYSVARRRTGVRQDRQGAGRLTTLRNTAYAPAGSEMISLPAGRRSRSSRLT